MRKRAWPIGAGGALLLCGAAVLCWCAWVGRETSAVQTRAQQELQRTPTPGTPLLPQAPPARGALIGQLAIPRLHLSVMVLEGDDARTLRVAAGHIPGTALAPHGGNIGIAAHRDSFFRPLRSIRAHDLVTLTTPAGVSRFIVSDFEVVRPTDVKVLAPAPGRDLTLVTCYPFAYIGRAPRRFVVHARQVS